MDDWGTSVWDTPSGNPPTTSVVLISDAFAPEDVEDAPNDIGDSTTNFAGQNQFSEDDFGDDFGDFGDGEQLSFEDNDMNGFQDADAFQDFPALIPTAWEPLCLDPWPSSEELASDVDNLLQMIWPLDSSTILTDENIRQVEGITQILITPERQAHKLQFILPSLFSLTYVVFSRILYHTLFDETPAVATKPPNWIRSRIRRQHLITLGIPINLDEIMPHSNGKVMPAINVTTRPSSAPPGPREVSRSISVPVSRSGTPRPGTPQPQPSGTVRQSPIQTNNIASLGPRPNLDETKVVQTLKLDSDTLALLPLSTLEGHLGTLKSLTADTSALLTYLLQLRETLHQDAETYNGLIAGLVGEAQKKSLGSKSRSGGKRGSALA
ncbi:hypothetical protein Clacol_001488 [Clathrus columnatus]|uniref:Uncharacterized protein n=1 Tax=Clathrus columnatus TaxID=1419009 RepID=A0AAV5A3Q6_9AGAM|nr:hypothetical protein Clacol_001488 [Clathrus columnatus]